MLAIVANFGMTDDRLEFHLWNWEQWMHRSKVDRGYPRKSAGGWTDGNSDFDTMVERVDARCARAVDAIIDGLPSPQRIAVHIRHLAAKWPGRIDIETEYSGACERIKRELTKRGIE